MRRTTGNRIGAALSRRACTLAAAAILVAGAMREAPGAVVRLVDPATGEPVATVVRGVPYDFDAVIAEVDPVDFLFSFGVVVFAEDPGSSDSISFDAVNVPPALDFDGVNGDGARIALEEGFAGAKGTVDVGLDPLVGYDAPRLATFTATFAQEGTFTLRPDLYNTLGPTEAIFVTLEGGVLDDSLTFETMSVTVIPEPRSLVLLLLAAGGAALRRRR